MKWHEGRQKWNAWKNECKNESTEWKEHMKEWMNEWRNEGMKEWRNDMTWQNMTWHDMTWHDMKWMKEWMNEWNECMNEWINDWMNEKMNEWLNTWLNEWMTWHEMTWNEIEWNGMNEWMNEWMNKWKNEKMKEKIKECLQPLRALTKALKPKPAKQRRIGSAPNISYTTVSCTFCRPLSSIEAGNGRNRDHPSATTDGHFTRKNTGFRARACFHAWIHAFPSTHTSQLLA